MKQTLLIAMFILFGLNTFAQLTANPQDYVGKTMIGVKPTVQGWHTYVIKNLKRPIGENNVVYPLYKYSDQSNPDSLTGRSFVCEAGGVYNKQFNYLQFSTPSTGIIYYLYQNIDRPQTLITAEEKKVIDDKNAEEKAYFKHLDDEKAQRAADEKKAKADQLAGFEEEQKKADSDPCSLIEYEYNDFDHIKSFTTSRLPTMNETLHGQKTAYNTSFVKEIKKGVASYYLFLSTIAQTPQVDKQEVIIILANGKRITRSTETVKTVIKEANFYREAYFKLNPAEIALLKASPLSKFRLYDTEANTDLPNRVYKQFICLFTK